MRDSSDEVAGIKNLSVHEPRSHGLIGRYAAEADGDDPSLFRPHANGDQGIGIILRGRAQPPKVNECAAVQDGAARPVLMRKQGGSGDGRTALVSLDGGQSALDRRSVV